MKISSSALLLVLAAVLTATAQTPTAQPQASGKAEPRAAKPEPSEAKPESKPDKAAAYYHYSLAHMYEEMVAIYGRSEYASRAIEEYRKAIEADPKSEFLNSGLAELYAKTGRISDAVLEAEDILKRDPNNLDAHKLLGRIYLRSLGDLQAGTQSRDLLRRAVEQYEAISALEPNNPENHLLLGRLYRIGNELLKAEKSFKRALDLQPDSEEAAITLAYLYIEEGDASRATQLLLAVPEDERSGKTYAALGYTYEQQKLYKKAVEAYKLAVAQDKDNLEAMRGLAQSLLNDNQPDAALDQYRAIVEADSHDAQSYMRIAEIQRRQGRFDEALASLKTAETEVPDSLEVPYNIAVIYQGQGKYDQAAQALQQLLQKSEKQNNSYTEGERNNRAVFLERLGTVYREAGKTQLSVDTFRRMIPLGEDGISRAYQQIIDTYRDAKQYTQATAAAQEATQKLPKDRGMKLVLASQMTDSGQVEKGLELAKAQLTNTPEDRDVYISLAQIYSRLKRWPESEAAIAKAEGMSQKQEEKDYVAFVAGSIFERQKKFDQAEDMFRRVLVNDSDNATALNYLGYMLADRGVRLEEALGYIKKALQLDPQNGAYLDSLGWAYYKLGNYVLAEENLRKASERIGNDPAVLDHLGDLYLKTDRLKMAAAYWERALREYGRSVAADVDNSDIANVQKKLESARMKLAKQGNSQ
ncbi:MAG TPA: tetratricopeptide repeat protein [Terriglobales bacterium]|jgi:tetratricopeptide (TPR) repeat protein|nr:tetratricopeptide repeat protein [Terriglobales bacterium]